MFCFLIAESGEFRNLACLVIHLDADQLSDSFWKELRKGTEIDQCSFLH